MTQSGNCFYPHSTAEKCISGVSSWRSLLICISLGAGSSGAAAELAGHSHQASDLQNMQGIEDTSILEDLAEAEEEYDRPEQVGQSIYRLHATSGACISYTRC